MPFEPEPRLLPGDAEQFLHLAQAAATAGRHQEAAACYSLLQVLFPREPEWSLSRAEQLARAGRTEEALAALEAVLRPDQEVAHRPEHLARALSLRAGLRGASDPTGAEADLRLAAHLSEIARGTGGVVKWS